jgi:hypothetical protein
MTATDNEKESSLVSSSLAGTHGSYVFLCCGMVSDHEVLFETQQSSYINTQSA